MAIESITEFYGAYPVAEMNEAVDRALPVVETGGVAVLSGMCGTSKTDSFMFQLGEKLGLNIGTFMRRHLVELNYQDSTILADVDSPMFIDEATPHGKTAEGASKVVEKIVSGVIVCAGLAKASRTTARVNYVNALTSADRQVLDLGDYQTSAVDATGSADLLRKLGFDKKYIEFIEAHQVMRNPRFFEVTTTNMVIRGKTTYDDLARTIEADATGAKDEYRYIANSIARAQLLFPHAIIHSTGFHNYPETQELYRIFDVRYPTDAELDDIQSWSNGRIVDPRKKS